LAAELDGTGVTVNIVYPGVTKTPELQEFRQRLFGKNWVWRKAPRPRIVEPTTMANLLLWLCSPATADMTGQFIAWDDLRGQRRLARFMWRHGLGQLTS
jgi:NAD(P)-dependent dehydrogenase (short-subunit alcohol dehydrogenase family)